MCLMPEDLGDEEYSHQIHSHDRTRPLSLLSFLKIYVQVPVHLTSRWLTNP